MKVLNRTVRRIVAGGLVRQKPPKAMQSVTALRCVPAVNMWLRPALPETGIVFRRVDIEAGKQEIQARYDNVVDTRLCTKIANEHGVSVSTIEHLMAALAGCEIDNAIIELNAEEVPVMDGSSAPFVKLIEEVGVVEQGLPRRAIRVLQPVTVRDGDKFVTIVPSDESSIELEIDFECPGIGRQSRRMPMSNGAFLAEIADSRTFGSCMKSKRCRRLVCARRLSRQCGGSVGRRSSE